MSCVQKREQGWGFMVTARLASSYSACFFKAESPVKLDLVLRPQAPSPGSTLAAAPASIFLGLWTKALCPSPCSCQCSPGSCHLSALCPDTVVCPKIQPRLATCTFHTQVLIEEPSVLKGGPASSWHERRRCWLLTRFRGTKEQLPQPISSTDGIPTPTPNLP